MSNTRTYEDEWVRDRLIALEIRARCAEWRCGAVDHPATARALQQLQCELRRGIWRLGVCGAIRLPASPRTDTDARLPTELRAVATTLRRRKGEGPSVQRLCRALDAASFALDRSRYEGRLGVYRTSTTSASPRTERQHASRARVPTAAARCVAAGVLAVVAMTATTAGVAWLPLSLGLWLFAWFVGLPPLPAQEGER